MPLRLPKPLTAKQQRRQARQAADQWRQALMAGMQTDQQARADGQRQEQYVQGLASALADKLRGGQTAIANVAGQVPGVILQQNEQAANPTANAAAVAAGGQAAPAATGAASFAALVGANTANALSGLAPSAVAAGNLYAGQARAQTNQRLTELGGERAKVNADAEDRFQQLLQSLSEQELTRRSAMDQSDIAWQTLGFNVDRSRGDQALDAARINQQAGSDAARLAQDQTQFDQRLALDQQRIDAEWARIQSQIARDRQRGMSSTKSERQRVLTGARQLLQSLRREQLRTPSTPGGSSTTTTGMRHHVLIQWTTQEPNDLGEMVAKPHEETVDIVGRDWNDVAEQIRRAYGSREGFAFHPLGQPTPVTTTGHTPGSSASSRPRWSDDQVRGHVYGYLQAAGLSAQEAKRIANQLVPRRRPATPAGRPSHL